MSLIITDRISKEKAKLRFPHIFAFFLIFSFLLACFRASEIHPGIFFEKQGVQALSQFVKGMLPPDYSKGFLKLMIQPTIVTVQISILGIFLAFLIGFPLSLLATSCLTWSGILYQFSITRRRRFLGYSLYSATRGLLSIFRAVPELVWGLIFVTAVGLGPVAAVLAIALSYGGTLGKVYSEIFDSVNQRPLETLQGTGASKSKIFFYAILPQAFKDILAYTFYRWECAIRSSAILGFVGAGGIGQEILVSMQMFNYQQVVTLIMILIVLVTGADKLSSLVREGLG